MVAFDIVDFYKKTIVCKQKELGKAKENLTNKISSLLQIKIRTYARFFIKTFFYDIRQYKTAVYNSVLLYRF